MALDSVNCDPCINRRAYVLKAILHGTSDDAFWSKLSASARQSALEMRIHLDLELYPPGGFSDEGMARDIRRAADSKSESDKIDGLIVTIPSPAVAEAVRYAAKRGMPVFGLNSGYDEVSGRGGLVEDGSILFFTAMNEKMGGEMAADYFLRDLLGGNSQNQSQESIDSTMSDYYYYPDFLNGYCGYISSRRGFGELGVSFFESKEECCEIWFKSTEVACLLDAPSNSTEYSKYNTTSEDGNATIPFARRQLGMESYTHALYISPLGEKNSAYQQRFDGYRDRLLESTNSSMHVEWFELNISTPESMSLRLNNELGDCKYQFILLGSSRMAAATVKAVRAAGCHNKDVPTKVGTFDTSEEIFDLVFATRQLEFAVDQYNHMQGWAPVHFAALYVTTGIVLSSPPEGLYLSGPVLYTQGDTSVTDTLRTCADAAFPVCPNTLGPDGNPSKCPCSDRSKIVIGGVVHGITSDTFWDAVFAAAAQGADDMGVDLRFDRFEPQESNEILFRKMSAKILSLCQGGVDGLFVSLSDPVIVDAVKICQELNVPVMSINAGFAESKEIGLIHHVGMVESNAGYQAGFKMAELATFDKAICLNYESGIAVVQQRCDGFKEAIGELGIEYGEVRVPDDNEARFKNIVETEIGATGDWSGYAILIAGSPLIPPSLDLKKVHAGVVMGSFDTNDLTNEAIDNGDLLFAIDQQPYLQGYIPLPILTHAAKTKQLFLNHAIESGTSFVTSSPNEKLANCVAGSFPVCPEHPHEDYNYISDALIILGYVFFAIQALASLFAIAWMIYNRKATVVRASQPEFLSLVAIGCVIFAATILPLSVQGRYRFERNAITLQETETLSEDTQLVDAACMAVPWLICIGFVLIYSALIAKLRRIHTIMVSSLSLKRIQVTREKVLTTILGFLLPIIAVLTSWTLISPLRWERTVTKTDFVTGFPTESFGRCTSEHSAAFASTSACVIALCLAYALVLSYKTRKMPVEFSESTYVS